MGRWRERLGGLDLDSGRGQVRTGFGRLGRGDDYDGTCRAEAHLARPLNKSAHTFCPPKLPSKTAHLSRLLYSPT